METILPVDFFAVTQTARKISETVIGYIIDKEKNNSAANYGIRINPDKSKLIQFTHEDKLIVISQVE
jgi:hypothetical protein